MPVRSVAGPVRSSCTVTDGVVGSDDVVLGDFVNPGYLEAGGAYANQATVNLPQGIDANYRFLVVTDIHRQVFEGASGTAARYRP